jgi:RimJ/RimL family protein N-acetyltransferase
MIKTERLHLVPVTQELKFGFQLDRGVMAAMIDATLPEGWPEFPQAFRLSDIESNEPWCGYVFVECRTRWIVGNGGFVSPPDRAGDVEIGYEIAPAFRGYGYATEAVEALIELAAEKSARFVFANTPAVVPASIAVARKAGMEFVDDGYDSVFGEIWRLRIRCEPGRAKLGHVSLRRSA